MLILLFDQRLTILIVHWTGMHLHLRTSDPIGTHLPKTIFWVGQLWSQSFFSLMLAFLRKQLILNTRVGLVRIRYFLLNIIHFQVLVSDKSSFWLLHFRTLGYSSWSLHSIDFFVGPHDINLYQMWQAEKEKEWREASRRKRERLSRVDTQFLPNNSTLDYDE